MLSMANHHSRRRPGGSSIMHQFAVLLFIAASAIPLICSSVAATAGPSEAADSSSPVKTDTAGHNNHHVHPHYHHLHRIRHHHPRADAAVAGTDSGHDTEATKASAPAKVLVGYADTYITKKAALELQDKLQHLHQPVTDEQYDEMLQKLVTKPKADPSVPVFSKVYYDYLPSETKEPQQSAGEGTETDALDLSEYAKNKRKKPFKKAHPFILAHGDRIELADKTHHDEKEQGERRAKRSVPEEEQEQGARQIGKRQTGMTRRQYERFESRRTVQARPQLVTFADHRFDAQPARYTDNWAAGAAQSFHRQPTWSNSRFRPYSVQTPDNWYLPVVPQQDYHQFIVRPQQPWMSLPIPGVNYNPAFPPKNPPFGTMLRPGVSVIRPDTNSIAGGGDAENEYEDGPNPNLGNRFGEDEDRFIFDVEERTTKPPPTQRPRPTQRFTTRRPPPPLIRDSSATKDTEATINNIFGNNPPSAALPPQQQPRTTTRRPPPPLIRNTDNSGFGQSTNQFGNTNTANQAPAQRPSPTRAPTTTTTTTAAPKAQYDDGPSRCVWAIVNCCQPQNRHVRYSCFEQFGCGGAFWDINPCNEDVFDSAIDAADKFVE